MQGRMPIILGHYPLCRQQGSNLDSWKCSGLLTAWLHPLSMLVGNLLLLLHPEYRMLIMQQKLREHIRIPGEFLTSGHNPTLEEAHTVHSRSDRKVRWTESCYLACKPTRLLLRTVPCFVIVQESMALVMSVGGIHLSGGMSI